MTRSTIRIFFLEVTLKESLLHHVLKKSNTTHARNSIVLFSMKDLNWKRLETVVSPILQPKF